MTAFDFTRLSHKAWKLIHLLGNVAPEAYKPPQVSADTIAAQLIVNYHVPMDKKHKAARSQTTLQFTKLMPFVFTIFCPLHSK